MNITSETLKVSLLFPLQDNISYRIPIYQRGYQWKTENIKEFFEDIKNEEKGYYIGNLLVTESKEENGRIIADVIDGQQRLTTLSLFLLALYDYIPNFLDNIFQEDEEKYKKKLQQIKKNHANLPDNLMVENNEGDSESRLSLLPQDQYILNNYLKVFYDNEKPEKLGNYTLGKRFIYIKRLIETELDDIDSLHEFMEKLFNVTILKIKASNVTDAFFVFSSLNAKGLPLSLIDLLKATYLGEAIKAGVSDKAAEKKWEEFASLFENENNLQNNKALTQFLTNNYDAFLSKTSASITKKEAYKKYEDYFSNNHDFINQLIQKGTLFTHIAPDLNKSENFEIPNEVQIKLIKLQKLDTTPLYPLLLFILEAFRTKK